MAKTASKKPATEPGDWRRRPRKPAAEKKSLNIGLKVTRDEHAMLKRGARAAKKTLRDFLVEAALGQVPE